MCANSAHIWSSAYSSPTIATITPFTATVIDHSTSNNFTWWEVPCLLNSTCHIQSSKVWPIRKDWHFYPQSLGDKSQKIQPRLSSGGCLSVLWGGWREMWWWGGVLYPGLTRKFGFAAWLQLEASGCLICPVLQVIFLIHVRPACPQSGCRQINKD